MGTTITPGKLNEYRTRAAADPGDVEARYWIGHCYYEETGGVEMDREEAARIWSAVLQNLNHQDSVEDNTGKIRYRLRRWYEDCAHAILEEASVEDETGAEFAEAMEIANEFVRQAEALCLQAGPRLRWEAAQGKVESKYWLGAFCRDRYGDSDPHAAVYWFERAAAQGQVNAQSELGQCYASGHGVEKDDVQSAYWYQRAAQQEDTHALRMLGHMYTSGRGVERDLVKAVECFDKATALGIESMERQRLLDRLSSTERERVLACVQRNKWIEKVHESAKSTASSSLSSSSSLGVWTQLALTKVVAAGNENKLAGLSPTYLCLQVLLPKMVGDGTKEA